MSDHPSSDAVLPVAPTDQPFVITRTFDAPRDLVFQAWTQCAHLKHWWGPKGFAFETCKIDLRPGGVFHYGMRAPDGALMWGKWTFQEVAVPERLVFVVAFSDAAGGETRHPFAPDWPLETLSTVTFTEHEGKTTLRAEGAPYNATPAERATFAAGHGSMEVGWGGTLDQFAEYLAQVVTG
jgi:uncharacterized protein YndB with AHSA1/START domain